MCETRRRASARQQLEKVQHSGNKRLVSGLQTSSSRVLDVRSAAPGRPTADGSCCEGSELCLKGGAPIGCVVTGGEDKEPINNHLTLFPYSEDTERRSVWRRVCVHLLN